jgi:hypothetical protein
MNRSLNQQGTIFDLLEELRKESGPPKITEEEYRKAAREINAEMKKFAIEQRAYFAQSIESARKAYITF